MAQEPDLSVLACDPDDPAHRALLAEATTCLEENQDTRRLRPLEEERVLIGEDLVFLPCGFIGSVGLFYVPSRTELIQLGSYTDVETFVWAHRRGVVLKGECSNALTISSIADRKETVEFLKEIFHFKYLHREVLPALDELPVTFEEVLLYWRLPQLREAEAEGYFSFEVS